MDFDFLRQYLVGYGLTPQVLVLMGASSLLVLFFSARILLQWYLGVHALRRDLAVLHAQLNDIQSRLDKAELRRGMSVPSAAQSENPTFRLSN